MWVRALADADADACGGKARGLARLLAAGLRVPDGFAIADGALAALVGHTDANADDIGHRLAEAALRIERGELPAGLAHEVGEAIARLAAPDGLAVRSSATIEDAAAGAAAGVYSSRTAVAPAEVWSAIRAVWSSALTPLAVAYARRRATSAGVAVIVQRFVPGERVVVYTRPPGRPDAATCWIQRAEALAEVPRDASDELVAAALAAERAIAAPRGADVELVVGRDGTWVVQARPIVHPPPIAERTPPPDVVLAPLRDGRRWTWDVAHNPDPLSPAQQGLVERIERDGAAPWSMRVCAGYLYGTGSAPAVDAPSTVRELAARATAIEARLAAILGPIAPTSLVSAPAVATTHDARAADAGGEALDDAIARYVAAYRIWAHELVPLIAATRKTAVGRGVRVSAVEHVLLRAARGELADDEASAAIADLAPAWDVAVSTYGERPGVVRAAIARTRALAADERRDRGGGPATTDADGRDAMAVRAGRDAAPSDELAAYAADLAERDDVWFARAQALVRRAILARAAELRVAAEDACWIPLDDLIAGIDAVTARRRASAARAAATRAAAWRMPRVVPEEDDATARDELRGIGSGGRVIGRIVKYGSLADASGVGAGDVIVVRAVTPALAVFVVGCAALVSETGGPLDHGAAMARELGIPCVVGCRDAMVRLADGMVVIVDGAAGTVEVTT